MKKGTCKYLTLCLALLLLAIFLVLNETSIVSAASGLESWGSNTVGKFSERLIPATSVIERPLSDEYPFPAATINTITSAAAITADPSQFWIYSAANFFAGGDGTKSNPYKIATPQQLALLAKNSMERKAGGGLNKNEYFELTADIDLAGKEWVSIGVGADFYGHFYGNGHIIKNMSQGKVFSGLNWAENGLFAGISGEVRDLGIVDANQSAINNNDYPWWTGILSTYATECVIENCFTTGKTAGYAFILNIADSAGLPFGKYIPSTISNCYSTAEGCGFIGFTSGAKTSNCYFYGRPYFSATTSGARGVNALITNSFVVGKYSTQNYFISTKDNTIVVKCYYDNTSYLGIFNDKDPINTDLKPQPLAFFKERSSYTNTSNWDNGYPWDFESIWDIRPDKNDGLPYLRAFEGGENAKIPTISEEPSDLSVAMGAAATLTVKANVAKGAISYQWYESAGVVSRDGMPIRGATGATYNAPTTEVGVKYYYCVITNKDAAATGKKMASIASNAVAVTVNTLINWSLTPGLNSIDGHINNVGQAYVYQFIAPVSGMYTFSTSNPYSLYLDATLYDSFGNTIIMKQGYGGGIRFYLDLIAGKTYSLHLNAKQGTGDYTLFIYAGVLQDAQPPVIISQPKSVTVKVGETYTFSVEAKCTDEGNLEYQWYEWNEGYLKGETSPTYTKTFNTVGRYVYHVRVINYNYYVPGTTYAIVYSEYAYVDVIASDFVTVTSITGVPTSAMAGTPLTLSGTVNPFNATNKAISWSVKSAGATGATINGSTLNTTAAGTATVTATIANGKAVGTAYTQDFNITVSATTQNAQPPVIISQPKDVTLKAGETYTFSVEAKSTDGGNLSYEWWYVFDSAGGQYPNATGPACTVTFTKPGTYYIFVIVTNTNNNATGSKTARTYSNGVFVTVLPAQ